MSGELRVILLLLGLVVILVVYLHARRASWKATRTRTYNSPGNDPVIDHLRNIALEGDRDMDAPAHPSPVARRKHHPGRRQDAGVLPDEVPAFFRADAPASAPSQERDAEPAVGQRRAEPPPDEAPDEPAVGQQHDESPPDEAPDESAGRQQHAEPSPDEAPAEPAAGQQHAEPPPDEAPDESAAESLGGRLKRHWSGTLNRFLHTTLLEEGEGQAALRDEVRLLVLHIRAPADREFYGREVLFAAEKAGLQCGGDEAQGAFEKAVIEEDGRRRIRFYMADMFEPGIFEWASFPASRVRGLSMFARLTEQCTPDGVFEDLVKCARIVATLLEGATILDEKHCTLTNQTINHMCERLREEGAKSGLPRE